MKSWLPTTLLLLYFTYYVFAIQDIELDPWSVGELMTARTLPSIVGVIALAVIIIQIVKTLLQRPQSRLKVETRIDKAVQSDTEALVPTPARIAPLAGTVFSFGLYVVSIDVLGFTLASMGFLTATAWILGYRQPLGFIGVCVGVPLLLAGLFTSIGIYLPAGTWIGGP
ncbi:MAG: tripartite tricarboxylate transporter TctB family protein [Gammaproteobacteria bacterium]